MAATLASYDREKTMTLICAKMSLGRSLRQICTEAEMPSLHTVMRWLDEDRDGELRRQYARGREALADHYGEAVVEIADDLSDDANSRRVRMDARKWAASKLYPKRYGDKVENTLVGKEGGPILIATGVVRAGD